MWAPLVPRHTSKSYSISRHVFTNATSVSAAIASDIRRCSGGKSAVFSWLTIFFIWLRRKCPASGVRSGDLWCRARNLPLPIYLFGKLSFKNWQRMFLKWGRLHPAGTVHHKAIVALRNVQVRMSCHGWLLEEKMLNDAVFFRASPHVTIWRVPLMFDNSLSWWLPQNLQLRLTITSKRNVAVTSENTQSPGKPRHCEFSIAFLHQTSSYRLLGENWKSSNPATSDDRGGCHSHISYVFEHMERDRIIFRRGLRN